MNKARLIKRKELIEREQSAQETATMSFAAKVKIDTLAGWVKRYREYRQPNARALFARLFAHPKTS